MRKLNVNYDSSAVAKVFAGEDKIDRLSDKLEELMNSDNRNPERSAAHTIQTAVELYADTIEEAIGIAMLVSDSIQSFYRQKGEHNGSLQSMLKTISAGKSDEETNTVKAIEQEFGSMKSYMDIQKCEDCSMNGNCATQEVADKVDVTWREGRKLE